MAKQAIGIGTVANDGTGDTLRDAFDKVNDNTTELYGMWRKHRSGAKYPIIPGITVQGGSASGANTIRFTPFMLGESITISELRACVSTLSASGNVQLAIYASDATTLMPTGNVIANTASLSTASTGEVGTTVAQTTATFGPGLFWAAANNSDATLAVSCVASSNSWTGYMIGVTSGNYFASATNVSIGFTFAQTFGTWPDMTANSITIASASSGAIQPVVVFKTT